MECMGGIVAKLTFHRYLNMQNYLNIKLIYLSVFSYEIDI